MDEHNFYPHSHIVWLLFCLFQMTISTIPNRYETDNDHYWKSTSYFTPIRGQTYGVIRRRKSMYFALKFVFYGKTSWGEWENILRIGEYGNGSNFGCTEHGNRFPALTILPSNNGLQISLSEPYDCWSVIEENYILKRNVIYNLIINYNQTHSTISVSKVNVTNNDVIQPPHLISNQTRTDVDDSLLGTFMDIIISDPLTKPAHVKIFDMMIVSYDDVLQFPVDTNAPTPSPTDVPTIAQSLTDDVDVEVTTIIAVNYTSNKNDTSSTNELIREITEDVMNTYVDETSGSINTTNAMNTSITVVIRDVDPDPYDVILQSNYTTKNETAIYLEAVFENSLETEILEKIDQSKNGSITINHFDIYMAIIPIYDSDEFDMDTTLNNDRVPRDDDKGDTTNMWLIWYVSIGGIGGIFCVFIIGFYVGWKFNNNNRHIHARQKRLRSQIDSDEAGVRHRVPVNPSDDDDDLDLGNVQVDAKLKQSSNDGEEDDPADAVGFIIEQPQLSYHLNQCHIGYAVPRMSVAEMNDIRNTIYSEVMGTPSGIQPIMNHVALHILDDHEDDEDIEDLYQDNQSDVDEIYDKPSNDTEITSPVPTEGVPKTAHDVAIPYYQD
eukprot:94522_1